MIFLKHDISNGFRVSEAEKTASDDQGAGMCRDKRMLSVE